MLNSSYTFSQLNLMLNQKIRLDYLDIRLLDPPPALEWYAYHISSVISIDINLIPLGLKSNQVQFSHTNAYLCIHTLIYTLI